MLVYKQIQIQSLQKEESQKVKKKKFLRIIEEKFSEWKQQIVRWEGLNLFSFHHFRQIP